MNPLEQEAQRLKSKYGLKYRKQIEDNLRSVSDQMRAAPGSIAVEEGLTALSYGLPSLHVHTHGRTRKPKPHKPNRPKYQRK